MGPSNISITAAVKTLKQSDSSAREDLLREAALMALFEHRNLVSLIGVVTKPRNIPAMIVLEYCEHGTLLDHVKNNDPIDVDTSMLLTYCHDVASGMHYISSRRIVHRDIAARNVSESYGCSTPFASKIRSLHFDHIF